MSFILCSCRLPVRWPILSLPRNIVPLELQSGNILPIFILTVIIPIIFYLILLNLGVVSSIFMPSYRERTYPVIIHIALLLMIVLKVIPNNYIAELYYFFIGLIISALATLLLLFLKLKVSMHLMGMGSLFMFLVCLSIHFEKNIIIGLSLFTLATGLVATSRLYLKAHSKPESLNRIFYRADLAIIDRSILVIKCKISVLPEGA